MKNILKLSVVFAILALFSLRLNAEEIKFETGSYKDVLAKAKNENKILMVDFFTDWCKWCVELDNKVYTNGEVAGFANKSQVNWKVDAEKGEGVDLAKKFKVSGYPTILFINGDGNEVDRIVGYIPAKDFLKTIKDYNAGINTVGYLTGLLKKNSDSPEGNYKLAEKKINNEGDNKSAKELLEKVLKSDPDNKQGYTDKAAFLLASAENKMEPVQQFMEKYPSSSKVKDAYMSLASMSFEIYKDFEKADNYYKQAYEKYGKDDEDLNFNYAQFLLGILYSIDKNKNSTNEELSKGIELGAKCAEFSKGSINEGSAYYYMASLYFRLGNKDKANDAIDKAISLRDNKNYRQLKSKINSTDQ